MNKELLISIKPEHLVNILNGKKTLELRKTVPKDYKGWVNIYCSKSGYNLIKVKNKFVLEKGNKLNYDLNGKVVARFWFDEYETISWDDNLGDYENQYDGYLIYGENIEFSYELEEESSILENLCLDYEEVENYLGTKTGYAWHIKKLEIFDKPKELSEFYKDFDKFDTDANGNYVGWYHIGIQPIQKAPLNYQFVYVKE